MLRHRDAGMNTDLFPYPYYVANHGATKINPRNGAKQLQKQQKENVN